MEGLFWRKSLHPSWNTFSYRSQYCLGFTWFTYTTRRVICVQRRLSSVIATVPHQLFALEKLYHLLKSVIVFMCMAMDVRPESSSLVRASSWIRALSASVTPMQCSWAQSSAVQIHVWTAGKRRQRRENQRSGHSEQRKEHRPVLTTYSCGSVAHGYLFIITHTWLEITLSALQAAASSAVLAGTKWVFPFLLEYEQQISAKRMSSERMKSHWIPLIILDWKIWRECSGNVKTIFVMYSK